MKAIIAGIKHGDGFVIHGKDPSKSISPSTFQRTYRSAFNKLGIVNFDNHDWRATFGTQLKESGMSSAQVADIMGHADTRMVETVYARSRQEGILKYRDTLEKMNFGYARGTNVAPKNEVI